MTNNISFLRLEFFKFFLDKKESVNTESLGHGKYQSLLSAEQLVSKVSSSVALKQVLARIVPCNMTSSVGAFSNFRYQTVSPRK